MSCQRPTPRLLYVGGFDYPTPQARGIQTLQTAHALARAGWCVRVLAQRPRRAEGGPPTARALESYGLSPHPRLRMISLPVLRPPRVRRLDVHARLALTNWSYGLLCVADLLRGRPRPDAILARDPRLAWLFLRTRRLHGRPVLYEVHEIFSTRPRENRSLAPSELRGVAPRTRALERAVFAEADLLLPLTRCCADLLEREYGAPPSRLAVVPDGTPTAPPIPPRDPTGREIVYAGQLYPWKGVDVLIRAMPSLPERSLTVLGGFPGAGSADADLARCQALAKRLGVDRRVTFAGFVPHGRIREELAGAGAGIVPLPDLLMSRYFTSPLKLFDYMAAGVPIVASDLPALREVLVDGENALLVPPDDPGALAEAIERLFLGPDLAERLRQQAFKDVAAYTWDRRAERIIEAARRVVSSQ